jgi:hypothetical protein
MTAVDGHAGRAHCAAHHRRPAGAANLSLRGRLRHGEVDRGGDSDVFIVEQPEASAYSYGAFHWCGAGGGKGKGAELVPPAALRCPTRKRKYRSEPGHTREEGDGL